MLFGFDSHIPCPSGVVLGVADGHSASAARPAKLKHMKLPKEKMFDKNGQWIQPSLNLCHFDHFQ